MNESSSVLIGERSLEKPL